MIRQVRTLQGLATKTQNLLGSYPRKQTMSTLRATSLSSFPSSPNNPQRSTFWYQIHPFSTFHACHSWDSEADWFKGSKLNLKVPAPRTTARSRGTLSSFFPVEKLNEKKIVLLFFPQGKNQRLVLHFFPGKINHSGRRFDPWKENCMSSSRAVRITRTVGHGRTQF